MAKITPSYVAPVSGLAVKTHGVYANSVVTSNGKVDFKDEKGQPATKWGSVKTVDLLPGEEKETQAEGAVYRDRIEKVAEQIGWPQVACLLQAAIDLRCSKKFRDALVAQMGGSDRLDATRAFIFAKQPAPFFADLCQALATRQPEKPILEKAFAAHAKEITISTDADPNVEMGKVAFDAARSKD